MKKVFCILVLYVSFGSIFAQKTKIDSLKAVISQKNSSDSVRVVALMELSEQIRKDSIVFALHYINQAIDMSQDKKHLVRQYCLAQNQKNYYLSRIQNYADALACLFDALKVIDQTHDQNLKGRIYTSIGDRYNDQQDYPKALEYYQKAIETYSSIDTQHPRLPYMHNNKANTYLYAQEYEKALTNLSMAFALEERQKTKRFANLMLFHITTGEVYLAQKKYAQASQYFTKAIQMNEKDTLDPYNIIYTSICNAQALTELGKMTKAQENLEKAKALIKQEYELIYKLHTTYSLFYKKQRNFEKALEYFEKAVALNDSIKIIETQKKTNQIKANYDFRIENELLKKDNEQQKLQQKLYLLLIAVFLIFSLLVGIGFYQKRKANHLLATQNIEIQNQQEEIQVQNEELRQIQEEISAQRDLLAEKNQTLEFYSTKISQSIRSARLIQKAILPPKNKMDGIFEEYFILYMPKDVVSGDFWWADQIRQHRFLVVADCTGHGVSGAFMTMIGNSLLDRIIRTLQILEPKEILEELHTQIQFLLQQEQTGDMNGMDLVVVRIDTEKIVFSGAKRPLYILQNGKTEKIAGNRKAIGGRIKSTKNTQKVFEQVEIIHQNSMPLYLCSDGYADQNNRKRQSFSEKRLLDLLQEIQHHSLAEQKETLKHQLAMHMDGVEQRDDILVIGIRV